MAGRAAYELKWQARERTYLQVDRATGQRQRMTDGPAWHAWLEATPSFAFEGQSGKRCTVRKENVQRGGDYWYAYHRVDGRTVKRYIGRGADLTLKRLEEVAAAFAPDIAYDADEADVDRAVLLPTLPTLQPPAPRLQRTTRQLRKARQVAKDEGQPSHLLLATKLYVPRPPGRLVAREHVSQRLQRGMARPLTLVAAPAGFGKTTALAEWAATRATTEATATARHQPPVAWVSLDASDNDPAQFWAYAFAALNWACPGVADTALAMVQAPLSPPLDVALRALLNAVAALPEDVALVLDDYHLITNDEIHQSLAALLEHPPTQFHLFIAARSEPPLPLARLRAYDLVNEVRADDLRLRPDEVATFLAEVTGMYLPIEDVMTLAERTDGWVAGVQLAARSLREHPNPSRFVASFTGGHRHVVTYLGEEILAALAPDVRDFLLHTAILDRLCAPLCNAVTARDDASKLLDRLEREELFLVPLDDLGHWYRYYHLFSDLLRHELERQHAALIPTLHRRAAAWLEGAGWGAEAAEHLFAAHDDDGAAGVIERMAPGMLMRGETLALLRLLQRLPAATIETHPALCLSHAEALISHGELAAADQRITTAEHAYHTRLSGHEAPGALTDEARTLIGWIAELRAVLASMRGDAEAALTLAEQALAALPPDALPQRTGTAIALGNAQRLHGDYRAADAAYAEAHRLGLASGDLFLATLTLHMRALVAVQRGQLRLAEDLSREAIEMAEGHHGSVRPLAGDAHVMLGSLRYQRNDLVGARLALEKALSLGEQWANDDQVSALAWLALVYQAQGQVIEAAEAMRRAETLITTLAHANQTYPWLPPLIAALSVRLALRQGRTDTVMRWLADYQRGAGAPTSYAAEQGREIEALTSVSVLLAGEDPDQAREAEAMLEPLLAAAESQERTGVVIEMLMLRALAHQAQGHLDQALADLRRSVTLAMPEGFTRLYMDAGTALRPLLRQLRKQEPRGSSLHHYLDGLVAAYRSSGPDTAGWSQREESVLSGEGMLPEPLSERERGVLWLLAQGLTNQEIAQQLVVEVSTVKTHMHHIFAKLDAADRLQAVTRARELGLLGR